MLRSGSWHGRDSEQWALLGCRMEAAVPLRAASPGAAVAILVPQSGIFWKQSCPSMAPWRHGARVSKSEIGQAAGRTSWIVGASTTTEVALRDGAASMNSCREATKSSMLTPMYGWPDPSTAAIRFE